MHRVPKKEDFFEKSRIGECFSRLGTAFGMVLFVNSQGRVERWIASSRKCGKLLSSLGEAFPLENLPLEDPLLGERLLESLRKGEEKSFLCSLQWNEEPLYLQGWLYDFSPETKVLAFRDRAERNLLERKMRLLARRMQDIVAAVRNASMGFWEWDLDAGVFSASRKWREIMGLSENPENWFSSLSPEEREKILPAMISLLPEEAPAFEGEYEIGHPWKERVWVSVWGSVVRRKSSGKPEKVMGCHQDISLRKKALRELEEEKIRFERLFTENSTAICVLDEEKSIVQVNPAFENLFGFSERELLGKSMTETLVPRELQDRFRSYYEDVFRGNPGSMETRRNKKDGSSVDVWLRSIPFTISSRKMNYDMYLDITQRKRALEKLEYLATTDMLTGISNRQHFDKIARKILRETREKGKDLSFIILDVDDFKKINDTWGHLVGDMVLQRIARGIRAFLDPQIPFGRWGGEEFVLLLPSEGAGARALAERLRNVVASGEYAPVPMVTASFGVAALREHHQGLGPLEAEADLALYRAKALGKNRVVLFHEGLREEPPETS